MNIQLPYAKDAKDAKEVKSVEVGVPSNRLHSIVLSFCLLSEFFRVLRESFAPFAYGSPHFPCHCLK